MNYHLHMTNKGASFCIMLILPLKLLKRLESNLQCNAALLSLIFLKGAESTIMP